eukprot:6061072-Pleurochrysis_carterae.AAC.1
MQTFRAQDRYISERFQHRSTSEDALSTLGLHILLPILWDVQRLIAYFPKSNAPIVWEISTFRLA